MGKGGFKELIVWQKGKDLAVYIYRITNTGDFAKDYGLETFTGIEKPSVEISRMFSKLISARLNSPCGIYYNPAFAPKQLLSELPTHH